MKKPVPTYDICTIDHGVHPDLLVERFGDYLAKHYAQLTWPHRHSFYHLVFFTKGAGTHTIDFEKFTVRPGQIYFMSPGQVHTWDFDEIGAVEGYIVNFNADLFTSFLHKQDYINQYPFLQGNSTSSVFDLPSETRQNIQHLLHSMLDELETDPKSIDIVRLLLLQLFIRIQRSCTPPPRVGLQAEHKLGAIQQFKQLVDKHYRTLRLPKEYAELMYITPNYLNALCKDVLGITAGDIIRDRILLEAKRELINPGMDIAQVAYALNFQDNSYFTRFFRKNTGLTPEQFRKQITQKI